VVDDERWCAELNTDEALAGSAPVADTHVFLEHLGPWPSSPLDALDLNYVGELDELDASIALARRPAPLRGSGTGIPDSPYVIVSTAGRVALTRTAGLPSAPTVADAIAALVRGELPAGWEYEPWLIMVCTHARRDACCARLGRPLVDDLLAVADPQRIWETTHLGGHRFAPTCLALPSQVVYGRVTSDRVPELAAAIARGGVIPDLMRGRTTYEPALQAAEVVARTRLGTRDGLLELVESSIDGDRTSSTWRRYDATIGVTIEKRQGPPRQLSCTKDRLETRPEFVAL
jgi:Sucrase/ferredoxin-like